MNKATPPRAINEFSMKISKTKISNKTRGKKAPKVNVDKAFRRYYNKEQNQWKFIGYVCPRCGKPVSDDPETAKLHTLICENNK